MDILNVEVYSMLILIILIINYIIKFRGRINTASLLWLTLTISTLIISISNIIFTISNAYIVRLISLIIYLLSTIISSLFVYIYVKYVYINKRLSMKKEIFYIVLSLIVCGVLALIYIYSFDANYVLHSLDRNYFNKLLVLGVVPNVVACLSYIMHILKHNKKANNKIIVTLLITVIGLILDINNMALFFVSSTFTLTCLIFYINKHEELINIDPLTGLANKRGLEIYVTNLKRKLVISVYNIDIDKFKEINDKYGHLKGDVALKTVANILRNSSRGKDLVVRNGGDEFLIIAEINNEKDAEKIIKRIEKNLKEYNETAEIKISLSIGWGLYEVDENNSIDNFNEFLKKIDADMYVQKEKKKASSNKSR